MVTKKYAMDFYMSDGSVKTIEFEVPQADLDRCVLRDGTNAMTANLPMGGHRVTGLGEPVADGDAVPLGYARKNGNPHNLLDNSDFRNPVNQRGQTVSSDGFIVDRWYAFDGEVTVSEDGIITTGNGYLQQRLPVGTIKPGNAHTLAVYYSDGTFDVNTNGEYVSIADFDIVNYIKSNGKTIASVALYEGEYTAETLPEYQPKGYGAELAECQRYYYKLNRECIGNGYTTSTGNSAIMHLPFTMRIPNPTIVYTDFVCRANGTDYVCDTVYSANADNMLYLACTSPGIPVKYVASFYSNHPIALSADL